MAREKIKEIFKSDTTYLVLLLFSVTLITIIKLFVINHFGPRWFYDSYDYFHYGEEILKGNLVSPEAKRTPGYPIFIAFTLLLTGKGTTGVAYMQVLFGLASLYLFYKIQVDMGLNKKLASINLIIFLIGPLSYFELNILSEAFTVFITLLFFRYTQLHLNRKGKWYAVLSVLTALMLILTRPQFILPLLVTAGYFFTKNYKRYSYVLATAVVLLTLGYSSVNYTFSKYFGMSSYLGYNLINHTGEYIEQGRALNPELVKIYLSKRDDFKKQNGGSQAFTIWVCNKEINEKLNYNFVMLSNELTRISVSLLIKDPLLYLESYFSALYKSLLYNDEYSPSFNKTNYFSFINLIIFVAGILLLLVIRSGDVFINFMKILFFINFLFAGFIDIGENFRHIVTLQFILIIAFTSGVYLIYKKIRFEELLTNTD